MCASNIRDNHQRGTVASFLQDQIKPGDQLSFVSAYFTVPAYLALRDKLDTIGSMRFLFGEPAFLDNLDPEHVQSKSFTLRDEGLALDKQTGLRAGAKACADWIVNNNVEIRSVVKPDFLHGKLYFIERGEVQKAVSGSSNFTVNGLGLKGGKGNYELNLIVDSDNDRRDLLEWFNALWEHPKLVADAREEVLRYLSELYTDRDPDFVYKKTLLALFGQEAERNSQQDAETVQTLKDTQIWKTLYEFQKDGAKGIINRIQKYGGCILADSVGLGKTFSALAVIKYFELKASQKARVLVLCPKKLEENWRVYLSFVAHKHNPFPDDAFTYTLLAHTDLSRSSGTNNGIDLENIRWDNFDLVVIDESHNLRNRKGSRYEKLMNEVVKAGKGTKFLLLSATPVNVNLSDLHNQIALFTGDDDGAFQESLNIKNLKTELKKAQNEFIKWSLLPAEKRTPNQLSTMLPPPFFQLLDGISIARSRKQIQEHYASSMSVIGSFPKRRKPISLHCDIDTEGHFLSYARLDAELSKYSLCVFKPSTYVLDEFKPLYQDTTGVANFSQEAREKYLIDMMKINFLKRLESSVHSFGETMNRTIKKIDVLLEKLKDFDSLEIESTNPDFDADALDADPELQEAMQTGKAVKYKLEHIDRDRWIKDLRADREQLIILQNAATAIVPARDQKLQTLKKFIIEKINANDSDRDGNPDRKILVFTAFADTANYLYKELNDWAKKNLNLESAVVTGTSGGVQSTFGPQDFSSVLANFSPRSKNRIPTEKMDGKDADSSTRHNGTAAKNSEAKSASATSPFGLFGDGAGHGTTQPFGLLGLADDEAKQPTTKREKQIDLLIATDCISEGQNLQDCGTLINYDIHWNPVRIIQRFGRIDRIGSRHEAIQMVNFWPVPDLNEYIRLQNRVQSRMALAVLSATGDDNLLAENSDKIKATESELSFRDQQLLRIKGEVLNLEEMTDTMNLSDFTLEEFRLDLQDFLDENRRLLENAPEGIFGVVPQGQTIVGPNERIKAGYLFCLRRTEIEKSTHYPYAPYYVVYISADGQTVHTSYMNLKTALDVWKATSLGKKADRDLCNQFDVTIKDGQDMSAVIPALQKAVVDIAGTAQKVSLKQALAGNKIDVPVSTSLEGYELVTWLAIV